ncbi:MAG: hypothetical protein MAG453_01435 [Calditrichaeota bacterium]|nr:hypothetical protein [Calditrichota bacterium]
MNARTLYLPALAALLAIALAAGCGGDGSDSISAPDREQTAEPTAGDYDLLAEDLGYAIADPEDGMINSWAPRPAPGDDPQPRTDDWWQRFESLHDTTFTHGSLTTTIDVTFFDAEGTPSEQYDAETTVRMARNLAMSGERESPHRQMTLTHRSQLHMDGISPADTVHVINETGLRNERGRMRMRDERKMHSWNAEHEWNTVDVRIHVDHEQHPYPLSGDVRHHTTMVKTVTDGRFTRTVEFEIGSTLTFNGTRYARVTLDNGRTYWIDLETGRPWHRP